MQAEGEIKEEASSKVYIGLLSSIISAISFSYMGMNFKKLCTTDIITLNHIFCLILTLFLPVFFPIEGLVSPTLYDWLIMVGFGLIFVFIMLFFIRAI